MSYDIDACMKLIIAMAVAWTAEYRDAYRKYLGNPSPANKARVKYWEYRLKDPFINLTDADLRTIQRQVEAGKNKNFRYRPDDFV